MEVYKWLVCALVSRRVDTWPHKAGHAGTGGRAARVCVQFQAKSSPVIVKEPTKLVSRISARCLVIFLMVSPWVSSRSKPLAPRCSFKTPNFSFQGDLAKARCKQQSWVYGPGSC